MRLVKRRKKPKLTMKQRFLKTASQRMSMKKFVPEDHAQKKLWVEQDGKKTKERDISNAGS